MDYFGFSVRKKCRIIENMKVFNFCVCFFVVFFCFVFLSCQWVYVVIGVMSSLQHRHRVLESFNKNIEMAFDMTTHLCYTFIKTLGRN